MSDSLNYFYALKEIASYEGDDKDLDINAAHMRRCAREALNTPESPAQQTRFTKLDTAGNGLPDDAPDWHAVLDNRTQLIWDRKPAPCGRVKHAEAMKAASEVILCGRPARAPTLPEQESLRDLTKYDPAIDTRYFNCPSSWFWTSTPAASPAAYSPAGYAWGVNFNYGDAYWYDRDNYGFVRAVRASEPSETKTKLDALALAQMNQEHASLCAADQQALKAFFEMNARFLMALAEEPKLRVVL